MRDTLGRPVRDLRISVTDRCNFRCPYCMPREAFGPGHPFLEDSRLMKAGELVRIVRAFVALGVEKVRLTGGEPLLRTDLPAIISSLKEIGVRDLSLTTNGWFLEKQAGALRHAGLDRINVSVDSLDEATAGRMNGLGFSVARVLAGIDAAAALGLPIKVNCVVQKGVNDGQILALCGYFRQRGHALRFIEFMDVGNTNHWSQSQVVPSRDIVSQVSAAWPLEPVGPAYRGEVASRYRYADGKGEIGIISSVTEPFCSDCTRARLSADGKLFTCLFASTGTDLLGLVRSGSSDGDISKKVASVWGSRADRYSDERSGIPVGREKIEMSYIGG
ncbi:MAG TPA: GTP 3',8-cyclase MoaA [Opitutaceae bacterium]|nr:GTP 3',8-cyclase MoaA [Opitutaceae bacterium]